MNDAARRHGLPPGGTLEMRAMSDGWPVRTIFWPGCDPAKGSILLMAGRGDFIEKYAETIHDLVNAGWGVASFDWRGQGLSGRLGDAPEKGHCTSFDPWLADLDELIGWFRAVLPGPWFAMAHSMGGHLVLRRLADGGGGFDRIVLLSPMLGMLAPPVGPVVARIMARAMVLIGRGGRYVRGGGPRIKAEPGSERQLLLTSDPERYADEAWWAEREPQLSIGSPTYAWLDAAFRSLGVLFAGLGRVATPLLILIPGDDKLVDNAATRRAQVLLPGSELVVFPGAGHELLREASDTRAQVLARALAFLMQAP